MLRLPLLLLLFSFTLQAQKFQTVVEVEDQCGQLSFMSNQEAEIAVDLILEQFSLTRTFVIQECPDIKNAVAKIVQVSPNYKERYIFYDSDFLDKADGSAEAKWGAYFILAHEIAHHLNGDSLDDKGSTPAYEIEADYFAGTALGLLGATLSESQRAIETLITYEKATATHPAKSDRLQAIERGWNEAKKRDKRSSIQDLTRKVVNIGVGNNIEVFDANQKKLVEFHNKAVTANRQKRYSEAAQYALKAYQYSDNDLEYLSNAASNFVVDQKLDTALKYLLVIVKKNYRGLSQKSINSVNEQVGLIYYTKNQIDDAIKFFEILSIERTDDVDVYSNLASAYIKKGDGNKALEYARIASKIGTQKSSTSYNLGTSFYQLGQDEEAIKYLRKAIDTANDDANSYSTTHNAFLNLSLVYWNGANKAIAEIKALKNSAEERPKYERLKTKVDELFKKAISVLEEGVRTFPNAQGIKNRLRTLKASLPK